MKPTLIRDYKWPESLSHLHTLTCKNHPTARYLTKNPFLRGVHLIKVPEGDIQRDPNTGECICPASDLMVVESADTEKTEIQN